MSILTRAEGINAIIWSWQKWVIRGKPAVFSFQTPLPPIFPCLIDGSWKIPNRSIFTSAISWSRWLITRHQNHVLLGLWRLPRGPSPRQEKRKGRWIVNMSCEVKNTPLAHFHFPRLKQRSLLLYPNACSSSFVSFKYWRESASDSISVICHFQFLDRDFAATVWVGRSIYSGIFRGYLGHHPLRQLIIN